MARLHDLGRTNTVQCQLCRLKKHITFACSKFTNLKPKCAKCGGAQKMKNHILKCYFYLGMGHMEDNCWKKNDKGTFASTNFLEVMVNDEETTPTELNRLCGVKNNIFSSVKMPKKRLHV
jgi:hypothetical protein